MEEEQSKSQADVRDVIRQAINDFVATEQAKAEPAYKAELAEERKRREQLERRMNEMAEENRKSRAIAEEAERTSTIRSELQRLGVVKLDLAYRAVKDDIQRTEDGRLVGRQDGEDLTIQSYLKQFVEENPELLPARITAGIGTSPNRGGASGASAPANLDLDRIRPGMNPEELERVRQEIARVANQSLRNG
ncbi:MAG: hypothetical protein K2X03_20575 [Bryobacteraceae bacterium]|nr:hypothetical protein [Bryobacteraceae bacterium]